MSTQQSCTAPMRGRRAPGRYCNCRDCDRYVGRRREQERREASAEIREGLATGRYFTKRKIT